MPGATELLLVRHGASADAVEGRSFPTVDGQGDPPLSELGHEQAGLVCARLRAQPVDAVYVTTLQRTVQTIQPFVDATGMTPFIESKLREVHLGDWEGGLLRQKVFDRDPIAVRMLAEQRWELIPGAESSGEFAARVRAGIDAIASAHVGRRVVIVTHGGTIGEALRQVTNSNPFAFVGADNGSFSSIVVVGPISTLRCFNDISHLLVTSAEMT